MSFMYNPFPYDDPRPVNRPVLRESTINSLVHGGTVKAAARIASEIAGRGRTVIAFDGYTTADFGSIDNLHTHHQHLRDRKSTPLNYSQTFATR